MKKDPRKAYIVAFLTAGAATLLYAVLFPFYRIMDYLICAAVALLLGRLTYVMAGGLDVSKKAPPQKKIPLTGDEAVDSLVKRGQEMLAKIRQENDMIPDEELSAKIDRLDTVSNKIFLTVVDQPAKAPQIRRFMEYYLPTTLKMLTSYRKLDERKVTGENADETKRRVEDAMNVVLNAFDKQLDQMYHDDMLDVSTNIDVLETMLKQDGLIDSGLHEGSAAGASTDAAQMRKPE